MPASDSDLRELQPRERKYKFSCGNALFVEVYPGGGKYFVWKYYFPPGRKGQQRWYQIGPYGKGPGKWTLKQARDEQARLDVLRKAGEDPRLLMSESKRELIKQATNHSLIKAAEGFLERSKNKPSTVKDYRNMLYTQVLSVLGLNTPVILWSEATGICNRCFPEVIHRVKRGALSARQVFGNEFINYSMVDVI